MVVNGLYPRIARAPEQSFFLFGVRGVGKSTWARTRSKGLTGSISSTRAATRACSPIPSCSPTSCHAASGRPGDRRRGAAHPGLLNYVHQFIEERSLRFVLLGSSARKLKTSGTNLLAGRALWNIMYPLVPEELGGDFDLDAALRNGTIPLVWTSSDRERTLESYVHLYLREEIRAESLVRNLPGSCSSCRSRPSATARW